MHEYTLQLYLNISYPIFFKMLQIAISVLSDTHIVFGNKEKKELSYLKGIIYCFVNSTETVHQLLYV